MLMTKYADEEGMKRAFFTAVKNAVEEDDDEVVITERIKGMVALMDRLLEEIEE